MIANSKILYEIPAVSLKQVDWLYITLRNLERAYEFGKRLAPGTVDSLTRSPEPVNGTLNYILSGENKFPNLYGCN